MWASAGFYDKYTCVSLMYMPSFVSEDYSFPFEVRQLAQQGRSERQLRAGFHTSPTTACHLGGKYVCRPQRKKKGGVKKKEEERKGASMQGVNGCQVKKECEIEKKCIYMR